jgi:hypothetical protein
VTVTKLWELAQADRWRKGARAYDVVVVDLPSSGHGVGLLRTARTFRDVTRVGARGLSDRRGRAGHRGPVALRVVAVALPGELPVSETLELEGRVARDLRRPVDRLGRQRPAARALARSGPRTPRGGGPGGAGRGGARGPVGGRARTGQQRQLARLRRGAQAEVVTLPFLFSPALEVPDVAALGAELARKL